MAVGTEGIRNIAIAGHGGTGKTTFTESLLFTGGAISKPEPVESGKTVSDYTDEEVEYKHSIHTSLSHLLHNDLKINVLDTPGTSDFVGEVVTAFRAAESAVMIVGGRAGVEIETIKLWRRLDNRNMPRIVFVNKMDEERADYERTYGDLSEKFDVTFVPVTIPIGQAGEFKGVIDLVNMKAYSAPGFGSPEKQEDIPAELREQAEKLRAGLVGAAAEGDDELTEKYLMEETLTEEEIERGLAEGLRANKLVPVLCGSALEGSGFTALLHFLELAAPSPSGIQETAYDAEENEMKLTVTPDEPFAGLAFKTTIDQYSGKLSFIKIVTGKLQSESEVLNYREGSKEKVHKIYTAIGKKLTDTSELMAGDIGVLAKSNSAHTNDTFCSPERPIHFKPLALPQPVFSVAFEAESRKDEDKLGAALQRVTEEDKTIQVEFNAETREEVLSGMGELHINMTLKKIREQQNVEVQTRTPRIAYRETITKPAEANYRHKKQSGGHGQFGEVAIQIRPLSRGEQYSFENAIKGMAVSKGYIPGIEKGLQEAMGEGIVAGYPAVDIGTVLVDGKEHPVDSSEMAFKMAAKGAMRDAMSKANPTLLEPIMELNVFIEEQYLGDVLSDLSSRRGRVLGQEQLGGGIVEIKAQVPQAELLRYAIDLRSLTSGTGSFEVSFDHYSPISGKVADEVIRQSQSVEAAS